MIGDEIGITEDYYLNKIGTLVSTIDMLIRRINAKDSALRERDKEIVELKSKKEKK